jgi:threonine aldolase
MTSERQNGEIREELLRRQSLRDGLSKHVSSAKNTHTNVGNLLMVLSLQAASKLCKGSRLKKHVTSGVRNGIGSYPNNVTTCTYELM